MTDDERARYLRLSDGRTLSYSKLGTGENGTWIHCHGIPGSRYELSHLNQDLCAAGLRVIIPDRPGYGDSTPCPNYGFTHHTADLCELADHLGLERFSISGFSGGGVFALAAAHDIGDRAEKLAIAATPAVPLMEFPFEHASKLTAGSWQAALADANQLADELQALTRSGDGLCEAMLDALGPDEKMQLTSGRFHHAFRQNIQTAVQQGTVASAYALARDTWLTARLWPFSMKTVNLPTRLIHGLRDQLVHTPHCYALSNELPLAQTQLIDDKGHYGVLEALFAEQEPG